MKMINLLISIFVVLSAACSTQKIPDVAKLSLRDPRLSMEARRWLADAEDEVVIARAGVDMAAAKLARIEEYQKTLNREDVFLPGKNADVKKMEASLAAYMDAQLALETAQLLAAEKAMALARARLTQVRAETAIRYDLAMYPMEPIVKQVEALKVEVGQANSVLEDLHVEVEKRAAQLWRDYAAFVKSGGITRNFWKFRRL